MADRLRRIKTIRGGSGSSEFTWMSFDRGYHWYHVNPQPDGTMTIGREIDVEATALLLRTNRTQDRRSRRNLEAAHAVLTARRPH